MTLRQRLSLTISIILVLFAVNVAMYFWSSHQRTLAMEDQHQAVSGQVHLSSVKQDLDELHKAILVLSALRETLAGSLSNAEVAQALGEIAALEDKISALAGFIHPASVEHYNLLLNYFTELAPMWRDFYLTFENASPSEQSIRVREQQFDAVMGELLILEDELTAVATRADQQINRIVGFTDRVTIAVFGSSILVTLFLAYVLLRDINRSLQKLHEGATAFGQGRLEHRIPIRSRDELGQLAQAFNEMSTKLQEAIEDVRQAQIAADEANHAKSRFLANMSHELRSPLTAIIGCSELLLEEMEEGPVDPDKQQEDIANIRGAGRELLRQINDLLDLSKIEAGKMNLLRETFDSVEVLQSILDTLRPLAQQSDNALLLKVRNAPPLLATDLTRFRQLFFNLLSNACKFTHHGQINVLVDYAPERGAIYRVRDSGIGMTREQMERVFEAFVQADDSTTREYGGTGLGLALCKQYCDLMGGSISVDSKPGLGTEFIVTLPIAALQEEVPAAPAATQETAPPAPADALTVLVIDDDPISRSLASSFLHKRGHTVITAEDGQQGIELANAHHPNLILLDVMMPKVDGWTVLSVLKENPVTADIPVILQSMLNEEELGLEMGAANYLQKPIDWQRLEAILDELNPAEPRRLAIVLDERAAQRDRLVNSLNQQGWHAVPCTGRDEAEPLLSGDPDALLIVAINDSHTPAPHWRDWLRQLQASYPRAALLLALDTGLTRPHREALEGLGLPTVHRDGFDTEALLTTTAGILHPPPRHRPTLRQVK